MSLTPGEAKKYPKIASIVKGLPIEKHFAAITDEMLKIIKDMNRSMKESNKRSKRIKFNYDYAKNNTK